MRWTLARASRGTNEKYLEWAIDVSSLHNLMQATGSCDAEEAVSHQKKAALRRVLM